MADDTNLLPSTPNPEWVTLVAADLRGLIQLLAGCGFTWALTVNGSQIQMAATIAVWAGTIVWSNWQKRKAARHTDATAVASARTGMAVQPVSASPSPNTAAGVLAICVTALALSACAVQQAPDPKVEKAIAGACVDSGLFKMADGLLTMAVPAASLPVAVVNAGIDKVCANPARFAGDVSTVEWVAKNLAAHAKKS